MERGQRELPDGCLRETLIRDYLAHTVAGPAAAEIDAHLDRCPDCRELVRVLERDPGALVSTTVDDAGGDGDDAGALLEAMRIDRGSLAGQVVAGKYRLGALLGSGGMGVVYEAVNTWTDRKVALKLLHPWLSADADTLDRFRREARIAGRLSHPSIVDVLDLGQNPRDGSLFMVQEFLTGETLRARLTRCGPVPLDDVGAIILPIMSALAAAHDAGVIHRDVKPENIILAVGSDDQVVPTLIDFGISKFTAADMPALLQTGRVMGTPLYMSPEQLKAEGPLDHRTDVWSVGVMLFELLAGQRPFQAKNHAEATVAILRAKIPSLRAVAPAVPAAVSQVVTRALEREREERHATMHAMRAALVAALPAPGTRAAPSVALGRRRAGWWALLALLVAATTALALAMLHGRRRAPEVERPAPAPVALPKGPAAAPPGAQVEAPPPNPVAAPSAPVEPPARSTPPVEPPARSTPPVEPPAVRRLHPKAPLTTPAPALPNAKPPASQKPPVLDL